MGSGRLLGFICLRDPIANYTKAGEQHLARRIEHARFDSDLRCSEGRYRAVTSESLF